MDVVIPAAGMGKRMGGAGNKLLLSLSGQPVIWHTVRAFCEHPLVNRVQVVVSPQDKADMTAWLVPGKNAAGGKSWSKLLPLVLGGAERQDSVRLGLLALGSHAGGNPILVHDGARPLVSAGLIEAMAQALKNHPAVVPVLPMVDTVRQQTPEGCQVIDREQLWRTQTPQGFWPDILLKAHLLAQAAGFMGTDDGQLVERLGTLLHLIPGEERNLKLTRPQDLDWGQWLLDHPKWGALGATV